MGMPGVAMEYARDFAWRRLRRAAGWGMPFVVSGAALWMLSGQIGPDDLRAISDTLDATHPFQLLAATLLSALSLWTVGRYDRVAHRHLQTGIDGSTACRSGVAAVALAQTLGFGLFTGALVRWRMMPSLGMGLALRLSAFVCLSFLAALALFAGLACLVLPGPPGATLPALGVLLCLPAGVRLLLRYPVLNRVGFAVRLPSLRAASAILFWAALDLGAAAGAFYVLLPGEAPGFDVFLPVFLIALGAALLSGAPGGVGPFELVLLSLLPQVSAPEVLAAVLIYRGVYYALPALIALAACALPARPPVCGAQTAIPPRLSDAPRAEVAVIRQNGGRVLHAGPAALAKWPTAQSLVGLFDPLAGALGPLLPALEQQARDQNRFACLYKITARTARTAREAGWTVVRIAQEAVLCPATFSLETPARRGLRRKLRQAAKAGVTIGEAEALPLTEMARIDADWQHRRGGARGGSMGRFCPRYLAGQRVFLAYRDDRLIAFVSFHAATREWCLDLMRSAADAPDGTMQALVHHAIHADAASDIPRLSLAAVPDYAAFAKGPLATVWPRASAPQGCAGLRQFKAGFAPRWQPLYAAAPGPLTLGLSLADIARTVHAPPPVEPTQSAEPWHPPCPHNEDEYNEVAPIMAS